MANISEDEIKRELQQMDPYKFEKLIAEIWELEGYETSVSKGSRDEGIDVEAIKQDPYNQKDLIQVKCYADGNNIGSKQIRNYATLYRQVPDSDIVIVVTSSDFTSEARSLAKELNVKTVSGDKITSLMAPNIKQFEFFGTGDMDENHSEGISDGRKEEIQEIIINEIQDHLRDIRKKANTGKYTTGEGVTIKFFDKNGNKAGIKFEYMSVSHDFARFRVQITDQNSLATVDLNQLSEIEKIRNMNIKSDTSAILTSKMGSISTESSVISHIVYDFYPDYSKEDELYFNEDFPESQEANEDDGRESENNRQQNNNRGQQKAESSKENTSKELYRMEDEFDRFN